MDIFWQITLVEALLNVAVFAIAVIIYGLSKDIIIRHDSGKWGDGILIGTVLGTATGLSLVLPINIGGGAAIGAQSLLIAFAGPLSGFAATGTALVMTFVTIVGASQVLDLSISNLDLLATTGAAAAGLLTRLLVGTEQGSFEYRHLPLVGLAAAGASLAALYALEGLAAVVTSLLPAVATNFVATAVIGTLLLHEDRRRRAEQSLRLSAANLLDINHTLSVQALELQHARDRAEQSSKAKSQFLAMMSHELRTPLNAIIGFAEIIRDRMMGENSPLYPDYAQDIATSGQHLLRLINDILDFSRAEAGSVEIATDLVDLGEVLSDCARMLQTSACAKQIAMEVHRGPELALLHGDPRRLRQIALNLLSNAVKFTPPAGKVIASVRSTCAGELELRVEDTGIGIPEDDLERVLEPFYQVDGRLARTHEGTGLGLPLTKHLAELHEATLRVRNRPGGGLSATVIFPVWRVASSILSEPTPKTAG